jgi:tetratricopeptide (TPR) repeat protein
MMDFDFFTLSKDALLKKYFGGRDFKQAESGIYLVAHTDTVHETLPTAADIKNHRGILMAPRCGLGADNRCGCNIVWRLTEIFPECGFLLSHDEESRDKEFLKTAPDLNAFPVRPKLFISFDAYGKIEYNDYGYWSEELESYLKSAGIARRDGFGTTSERLSRRYGVPCVNLCFGGGCFHFESEYVDTSVMERLFEVYVGLVKFALANRLAAFDTNWQTCDSAIADFTTAIRLNPNDAEAYCKRGKAHFEKGDYDSAIADFSEAIRLNPDYAGAYYWRGRTHYVNCDDENSVIADFTEVIRLNPNDAEAYYRRGSAYSLRDNVRAIADFTEAIRLAPDYAEAYYSRGHARDRLASDAYFRSFERDGNAHYNKDDCDNIIADYTEAIRLAPDNAWAYHSRGYAYEEIGDYDSAIADYTEAIRLDPCDVYMYHLRGGAYEEKGDYDSAIADYSEYIRLGPDPWFSIYEYMYTVRGYAYYKKGDYVRAIADYTEVILFKPENACGYNERGNAHSKKGDYDSAIADYTEAIRLAPDYAFAYRDRGEAYGKKGDIEKAIADYREALRLNPDCEDAKEALAALEERSALP